MYGGQLQDLSIQGHEVEGKMNIEYEEVSVSLSDGEQVSLRIPTYSITDWKYGEPHKDLMISPRIAPPMIGLGLLEAIDEKDILSSPRIGVDYAKEDANLPYRFYIKNKWVSKS